jgi:putative membrane protein
MKTAMRIGAFLGMITLVSIFVHEDVPAVTAAFAGAGWVLLLLIPFHAIPLLLDVLGWRVLIPARTRLFDLFVIASIREAINRLLPVANVGGELVGIRLLTRCGIAMPTAAATVIIETLLNLLSQGVFVAGGLICLLALTGSAGIAALCAAGLATSLPMIVIAMLFMRRGKIFARIERAARHLLKLPGDAAGLSGYGLPIDVALSKLLACGMDLGKCCAWQVVGYVVGVTETWVALSWLGRPVGFAAAVAMESLAQAARSIVFLIPAGLGVQEATLVAVGLMLGIDGATAVSLSLVKRMRELFFGLPSLAVWLARDIAPPLVRRD